MMKSAKGHHQNHQEEEVEEDEEFGMKKDAAPSNSNPSNNTNNAKDGKNSDKANVMRSKHSVTEQKRRSKINERFQILRDLIPHSDQKRDTASFLLEVIEYVQFLQEKVQKYEGSYQPWSSEPTKLMPWRNSHWRVQSLNGSSVPPPIFPTRFDENNVAVSSNLQPTQPIQIESLDPQTELINKSIPIPIPLPIPIPIPSLQNDVAFSIPNQQEEPIVEGGTINISSTYSQGLLNSLTQALQTSGVDLSQATISVQINLGKQQIKELVPKDPGNQQMGHYQDMCNGEELDQTHKRMKI